MDHFSSLIVCSTFALSIMYFGKTFGAVVAVAAWTCVVVVVVVQLPLWTMIWRKTRDEAMKAAQTLADKSLSNTD